jgi:hypothetical protein
VSALAASRWPSSSIAPSTPPTSSRRRRSNMQGGVAPLRSAASRSRSRACARRWATRTARATSRRCRIAAIGGIAAIQEIDPSTVAHPDDEGAPFRALVKARRELARMNRKTTAGVRCDLEQIIARTPSTGWHTSNWHWRTRSSSRDQASIRRATSEARRSRSAFRLAVGQAGRGRPSGRPGERRHAIRPSARRV